MNGVVHRLGQLKSLLSLHCPLIPEQRGPLQSSLGPVLLMGHPSPGSMTSLQYTGIKGHREGKELGEATQPGSGQFGLELKAAGSQAQVLSLKHRALMVLSLQPSGPNLPPTQEAKPRALSPSQHQPRLQSQAPWELFLLLCGLGPSRN